MGVVYGSSIGFSGDEKGGVRCVACVWDVSCVCGMCCVCVCVGRVVCVWDVLCVLGTVAKMVIFTPGVDLVLSAL